MNDIEKYIGIKDLKELMKISRKTTAVTQSVRRRKATSKVARELQSGDRLLLKRRGSGTQEHPECVWSAKVEAVTSDGLILVLAATDDRPTRERLGEGEVLEGEYDKDFGRQFFATRVRGRLGDRSRVVIERPAAHQLSRVPRRWDYRVGVSVPATITVEGQQEQGIIVDISAGGCSVHMRRRTLPGTEMTIAFELAGARDEDRGQPRCIRALQRSCVRQPAEASRTAYPYRMGLRFVDPDEPTRDALSRFVAVRQRQMIQRGLLTRTARK